MNLPIPVIGITTPSVKQNDRFAADSVVRVEEGDIRKVSEWHAGLFSRTNHPTTPGRCTAAHESSDLEVLCL
jgi:hypothetical protein